MSFFNKNKTDEEKEENNFTVRILMDNGNRVTSGWMSTEKEAKKELERIKQTKGKYFSTEDGRLFLEMEKITYAIVIESSDEE